MAFRPKTPLTIRSMTAAEVALAVEWAANEGWNPGLDDAALFRTADPDGFLVALQNDEPMAVLSVVAYGPAFGFLGLYIVRPDRRGQGIGHALWRVGMARFGERTVGLDGVVAQQANYRRSGFVFAHRNIRFSGVPTALPPPSPRVRRWDATRFDDLAAFDALHFPAERRAFLHGWLSAPGHRVFVVDGVRGINGYGVIRPSRQGYKIGPLFAGEPMIGADLFAGLIGSVPPGADVVIDVPEPNEAAVALVQGAGIAPVFETARMYRGTMPNLPLDRIFGITTFELG